MSAKRTGASGGLGAVLLRIWAVAVMPVIAIGLALVVGAVIMLASTLIVPNKTFDIVLPVRAYIALFQGAAGSFDSIVTTLKLSTPLLLAGLGVGLGFRAGLFNIGAQGQFLMGALGAVAVGAMLSDSPAVVAIPLALIAGVAAGAAMGFVPGLLKATSGAHEVVTTIMFNYIALAIMSWAITGPLRLPKSPQPVTGDVGNAALPIILGRDGSLGIVLALLTVPLIWFLLQRTTRGFEIRAVGANPDASRYAGMHPRLITVLTMSLAGGLAGFAGATNLLGINHHMNATFSTTVGFDSITVALLGRSNPVGILFAALLFGGMRAGAGSMEIQAGVPVELVDIVQAIILIFLVVGMAARTIRSSRRSATGQPPDTGTAVSVQPGEGI